MILENYFMLLIHLTKKQRKLCNNRLQLVFTFSLHVNNALHKCSTLSCIDFIFVLNELPIIIYREKLFGKINWVCTICGQDFTRRSSGKRHNSNLHGGMAKLVRPFDYITVRLNGQISSPAYGPSACRRYRGHDNSHYRPDNHGLQISRTFLKQNDVR
jgi:hypothetical protein